MRTTPRPHLPALTLLGLVALLVAAGPARARAGPDLAGYPVEEALQRLDAGEAAAAVDLLEPFRDDADAPPPVQALLGLAYLEAGRPGPALEVLEPMVRADDADPGVLYNAGRAALALGSVEEAAGYLERSLARVPDSPAARELGLVYAQVGEYHRALALLRPWALANPDDREARLAAAFAAVQLSRAPDAEELLSDLPQDLPRVRLLWGKVLLLQGDPYGAIATLKPLVDDAPAEIALDVRRTLAEAHVTVGQGAEAVALLEDRGEGRPRVALQLAQALYQSGDLDRALATLGPHADAALARGEEGEEGLRASLILEQGRLLVAAGRHDEALPFLVAATELRPGDKLGWQSLGQALAAQGRTDEAQAALERFREITHSEVPSSVKEMQLEKDVDDPTGRELRQALRLLAQERPEEALLIARREADLAAGDPRPRLVASRVLLELGRTEDALAAAEEALEIAPGSADAHYQRGVVLMSSGELQAAESELRQALEIAPDHTATMNDLAVLLMQSGRQGEARELLERVLELRPEDALAQANLERLDG